MGDRPIRFTCSRKSRSCIFLKDLPRDDRTVYLPHPMTRDHVNAALALADRTIGPMQRLSRREVRRRIFYYAKGFWRDAVTHAGFPGSFSVWCAISQSERKKWITTVRQNKGD